MPLLEKGLELIGDVRSLSAADPVCADTKNDDAVVELIIFSTTHAVEDPF